jgi:hypothetical protein
MIPDDAQQEIARQLHAWETRKTVGPMEKSLDNNLSESYIQMNLSEILIYSSDLTETEI